MSTSKKKWIHHYTFLPRDMEVYEGILDAQGQITLHLNKVISERFQSHFSEHALMILK